MWAIQVTVNNVKVTKKCAKELFKAQQYEYEIWSGPKQVTYDGKLTFNSDHNEHMDYLGTNDQLVEILKKYKVKGDICFGDLEGDQAGSFWGYRFDGKGGMVNLIGTLVYMENKTKGKSTEGEDEIQ